MIIQAPLMTLIEPNDVAPCSNARLRSIERAFQVACPSIEIQKKIMGSANRAVSEAHPAAKFRHRLSPAFRSLTGWIHYDHDRSGIEAVACAALRQTMTPPWLMQVDDLRNLIESAAGFTGGGTWRYSEIYTKADNGGHYVRYPAAIHVNPRLEEICSYLRNNTLTAPALTAVVALCAIFNLHPLTDGNGRVGHILFNYILQFVLQSDFYLPAYDIAAASSGGWIVALRMAQLDAKWDYLIEILDHAVLLFVSSK